MLNSYLPLLREFIPSAASEIESDLSANSSKQGCCLHVNELLVALGAIIHLIFDISWSKGRRMGFLIAYCPGSALAVASCGDVYINFSFFIIFLTTA